MTNLLLAAWRRLARLPRPLRLAVKLILQLLFTIAVLFPNPILLVKQILHLRDPESLIQATLPALTQINAEIDDKFLPKDRPATGREQLDATQKWVYHNIPYVYDWDEWGVADYWPTTAEVLATRREDCDGRAVLAVSLLRARGISSARLAASIRHVWAVADLPEEPAAPLMSPDKETNIRIKDGHATVTPPSPRILLQGAAFTFSEFPPARLALIGLALLLLIHHPREDWPRLAAPAAAQLLGILFLVGWGRVSLQAGDGLPPINASLILGAALLAASFLMQRTRPKL